MNKFKNKCIAIPACEKKLKWPVSCVCVTTNHERKQNWNIYTVNMPPREQELFPVPE